MCLDCTDCEIICQRLKRISHGGRFGINNVGMEQYSGPTVNNTIHSICLIGRAPSDTNDLDMTGLLKLAWYVLLSESCLT